MPFIGIVAKENDSNFIKNAILKNAKFNRFEVVNINLKSIENIKNIKFDSLIINENIENFLKNSKYLESIINKAFYIIINSDIENNLNLFKETGANVITYGLNSKSSLTVSSIKEENILLCIQRCIEGINKELIEEQEINIKLKKNNVNKVYNVLAIFAILKIYGENLQKI